MGLVKRLGSRYSKAMISLPLSQSGEGMVPILIALALLGGGALGVSSITKMMFKQSSFSNSMGTALAIESSIVQALQSPETYDANSILTLAAGSSIPGKTIQIDHGGGPVTVAIVGGEVKLGATGKACSGKDCVLTTHLDISCATGLCRAAYRIDFAQAPGVATISSLGASRWPPAPEDFTQVISYDLYRRAGQNQKCAAGELFVSGMNRGDGSVSCVRPAGRRLASNEIPKGVEYNLASNSLDFKYATLKMAACPAKYVMQTLDPASLEGTPSGMCVYRYKKELPWMQAWPSGAEAVNGAFCPAEDYEAVANGSCTMSIVSQTNGYCPRTCSNPDGSSYECGETVAPDTSHRIDQSVNGPNVSCALVQTGSQRCGASWSGQVQWSGVCRITVPEQQPAGGG